MLFSTLSSALMLCLASVASAQKASIPYPIVGYRVNGTIPLRRNINDLQREGGPHWDLFIQASAIMRDASPDDPLSFFQVAGIHGLPHVEWNNTGARAQNTDRWAGYCPHGEPLFLTWHRIYVLLNEQILVDHAREIAGKYPESNRNQYLQAAETLRYPYWDWADNSDLPPSTASPNLTVNGPQGQESIENPLAGFKFPAEALSGAFGAFDPSPIGSRTEVMRCASPGTFPASANLQMKSEDFKQLIYDAFLYSRNFADFASARGGGLSMEEIHNTVHTEATCFGHFASQPFAAFDPIFTMHHVSVDRFFSYWEILHQDEAEFTKTYQGGSRWGHPEGNDVTPATPLHPFFRENGKPHTPRSASPINRFGYTYEGLDFGRQSTFEMQKAVRRIMNEKYSNNRNALQKRADPEGARPVFLARFKYNVEEFERPAIIKVFFNNDECGRIIVPEEPHMGMVGGAVSLEKVLPTTGGANKSVQNITNSVRVEITRATGERIPLAKIPSMKLEMDHMMEVPNKSPEDFPELRDRESIPGQLAEHLIDTRR
ncbi:hypothetical protein CDD81_1776 [Ophiocordyceps australis]|uniref:Tyrosinase copper-binding domain-containing protein n=1 Tax=Ophiocordyceps australis TaxID=1399860 RepID=A0A2C5YDY5_9HYPO|nr:hypothetical protein CDD81_1776 [Ophiocordyceps australis]